MSVAGSVSYSGRKQAPCLFFASDNSCHDEHCWRDHHENLDPALVGTIAPKDYMVPDEYGIACKSCFDNLRECDKQGRPGDDDPCSECRQFGGENRQCVLAPDISYNKVVWDQMVKHGPPYTLPPPKNPLLGKKKKPATPMPAHRVRDDWVGQSRVELLAKQDFLPAGVRERPRAFVVDPGRSNTRSKGSNWVQTHREDFLQPIAQDSFAPPPMPRPAPPAVPWHILDQYLRPGAGPAVAVHVESPNGELLRVPRDMPWSGPFASQSRPFLPPRTVTKRSRPTNYAFPGRFPPSFEQSPAKKQRLDIDALASAASAPPSSFAPPSSSAPTTTLVEPQPLVLNSAAGMDEVLSDEDVDPTETIPVPATVASTGGVFDAVDSVAGMEDPLSDEDHGFDGDDEPHY